MVPRLTNHGHEHKETQEPFHNNTSSFTHTKAKKHSGESIGCTGKEASLIQPRIQSFSPRKTIQHLN